MSLDTPSISSSSYATSVHNLSGAIGGIGAAGPIDFVSNNGTWFGKQNDFDLQTKLAEQNLQHLADSKKPKAGKKENLIVGARRLVKVVIVDPDENVPLADCILYSGEEKLTDSTDQELFFEIDIKKLLDDHNAKRILVKDKKIKERIEYLEPAKIRELKMVVVNIAQF